MWVRSEARTCGGRARYGTPRTPSHSQTLPSSTSPSPSPCPPALSTAKANGIAARCVVFTSSPNHFKLSPSPLLCRHHAEPLARCSLCAQKKMRAAPAPRRDTYGCPCLCHARAVEQACRVWVSCNGRLGPGTCAAPSAFSEGSALLRATLLKATRTVTRPSRP